MEQGCNRFGGVAEEYKRQCISISVRPPLGKLQHRIELYADDKDAEPEKVELNHLLVNSLP